MHLDFSVVANSLPFLWKGFQYTVQLTAIAALGGIFFGTLLALARLSSAAVAVAGGGRLRQPDALDSAGAGHLLVFLPDAAGVPGR